MAGNMTVYKRFLNNCLTSNVESIKYLLNNNMVDPSEQNNKAIRLSFYNEHYDIVKILFGVEKVSSKLKRYQPNVWRAINEHKFE